MSAKEVEALTVLLTARTAEFERGMAAAERRMDRAEARIRKTSGSIEARVSRMTAKVQANAAQAGAALTGSLSKLGGSTLVGAASIAGVIELSDAYKRLTNQLRVAGVDASEVESVYDRLARSAAANYTPIDALVSLFARVSSAAKELGVSREDAFAFTDNIAQGLRVSGVGAKEASGALLQLGQALSSGKVQAEEWNSIVEGTPALAQAAARGMLEAGGSVAKLKGLINDGEVSSRALFEAMRVGAQQFGEQLAGTETTVSGAFENVKSALTTVIGRMDSGTQTSRLLVDAIDDLRSSIERAGEFTDEFAGYLSKLGGILITIRDRVNGAAEAFGKLTGLDIIGRTIKKALGEVDVADPAAELTKLRDRASELEEKLKGLAATPISIKTNASQIEKAKAELASIADEAKRIEEAQKATPAALPARSLQHPVSKPILKPISTKDFPVVSAATSDAKVAGLAKSFGTTLSQFLDAAKAAGHNITVASGTRSVERQAELWAKAVAKYGSEAEARKWVAPPGRSMHNAGKAADLGYGSDGAKMWAHQNASSYGLTFPLGNEPWHIEQTGARRGGRAAKTDEERETEKRANSIQRVTAALALETEQIGKTEAQQRVLQEVQAAGVNLNSTEGQAIATKVAQLYALKAAADAATLSTENLQQSREEMAEVGADAVKGFVADLKAGTSAADALKNALDRILTRLLDSAIDGIFSSLFKTGGSGGGGLFASLFSGLSGGKASGGRVSKGQTYPVGEHGRELFVPGENGRIVPNSALQPVRPASARGNGGGQRVEVVTRVEASPYFDARVDSRSSRVAQPIGRRAYADAVVTADRNFPARQSRQARLGF